MGKIKAFLGSAGRLLLLALVVLIASPMLVKAATSVSAWAQRVGLEYNSTALTLSTDEQGAPLQGDTKANLKVTLINRGTDTAVGDALSRPLAVQLSNGSGGFHGGSTARPVFTTPTCATLAVDKISVTTSATLLKASNSTRRSIVILNEDGTNFIRVGPTTTLTSGFRLKAGESININTTGAIYAVADTATCAVSFCEQSD